MKKAIVSAALALSVIASSLAVSKPASAFQLRNLADQSKFLGVSAGTPTAGTHFIIWTQDNPHSANQSFSTSALFGSGGSPASSVVAGQTITLFNGVAMNALVDISASKAADGINVVVGYALNGIASTKQTWFVDDSLGVRVNNAPCFRLLNSSNPSEALGVAGGNMTSGTSTITWHTFSDWSHHMDQLWCPVD